MQKSAFFGRKKEVFGKKRKFLETVSSYSISKGQKQDKIPHTAHRIPLTAYRIPHTAFHCFTNFLTTVFCSLSIILMK